MSDDEKPVLAGEALCSFPVNRDASIHLEWVENEPWPPFLRAWRWCVDAAGVAHPQKHAGFRVSASQLEAFASAVLVARERARAWDRNVRRRMAGTSRTAPATAAAQKEKNE